MSQRRRRSLALLTSGVLALPLLAGCGAGDEEGGPAAAGQDIATTARDKVADGGVLRWAVDALPGTLNTFQADADATTNRIAGAVLPQLFVLDGKGRPVANPDYLEKAEVVEREPKQVVLYKLNQQAVWSDGREIGAADFVAQWRALNGKDSAYWTARNAGYDRIEKIERGKTDLEVKVTFIRPYADWRSLFSPLYPKQVMGTPEAFNEGARGTLKVTAGPFALGAIDKKTGTAALTRNPRWWGRPAKLDTLVLTAVPRAERPAALAAGKLDLAEIDRTGADRIALARRESAKADGAHGPAASVTAAQATLSWAFAFGADEAKARSEQETRQKNAEAVKRYADEQGALRSFTVRKSLEPTYTQLALNGASGPLADERVRRAVARVLDRQALADIVLKPLGLPAKPVGSHLALAGQQAYADNSGALGGQDTQAAQALLSDAGWRRGGKITEPPAAKAGAEAAKETDDSKIPAGPGTGNDGLYIVGQDDERNGEGRTDDKPAAGARAAGAAMKADHPDARPEGPENPAGVGLPEGAYGYDGEIVDADSFARGTQPSPVLAPAPFAARQEQMLRAQADAVDDGKRNPALDAEAAGEPADPAKASTVPAPAKQAVRTSGSMLAKDGKALSLRFVLPSGPGSEALRTVGERIAQMLHKVGVQTELTKVADESFFKDHIASGQYDLALYSWPATAYPATDARPIFAKPEPAADGSLLVEQNYTRVGTDHIDQLFDQAAGELDEETSRDLMRKADARIWAAAGSIPLYQRPELVAVKPALANAGAFGLGAPRYQDIGWKKPPTANDKNEKKK
ncbi:ABC transporter family substrate-binding protein [Streptomyces sp. ISL-43]|uniref:ABC transporter family substrate-binding protein n=1 Tax=Streptomyces sp. ISL-43 TaxID=2819183 RepID=UPI001BE9C21C|nr:ABC transporter family substrate-binding protein [Streptomyces sp. ISL-43]MBT2448037.1 ABC transporter family substrate-binding protein [Streptomyces sp. ISL-43]